MHGAGFAFVVMPEMYEHVASVLLLLRYEFLFGLAEAFCPGTPMNKAREEGFSFHSAEVAHFVLIAVSRDRLPNFCHNKSSASASNSSIARSTPSGERVLRLRFCGCNSLPAHRPVRKAPQNARSPRSLPSALTPFRTRLYLLTDVLEACNLTASSSRNSTGKSGSSMRRSNVLICKSGSPTP